MKLLPACAPLFAALLLAACALSAAGQDAVTAPDMPNRTLTPGDTLDVTLADIQVSGYSAKVRNVPISVKRQVYASYGIQTWGKGEYEVDHLIPLSLGGSNSTKNLWPESYLTEPWNAHTKDQLEYKLLQLVRSGQVDLHTAQQEIATDWIAAYKKYVSPRRWPPGTGVGAIPGAPHTSTGIRAPTATKSLTRRPSLAKYRLPRSRQQPRPRLRLHPGRCG